MIEALRASGIEHLFCLPGVQNDDFFNRLIDAPDITPIMSRHEQGAAYMAMGAAQITNKPAAFCVVPGPGMLNAAAAMTSAYWAYGRVLAIIGQIPTSLMGKGVGALHELEDQTAILRQLTKHAVSITDPAAAVGDIENALDELHNGVPRPVSIEVPVDIWSKPSGGRVRSPQPIEFPPDPTSIEQAADLIRNANQPLIVVGSGAHDAAQSVRELATKAQIPVTTRRQGHGVLPTDHPMFLPLPAAYRLWPEVDLAIGVGSRMEWPLNNWGVDDDLQLIQINIDSDEVNRHGITTVGMHADSGLACEALLSALGDDYAPESRASELDARRADFEEWTSHLIPQREYTAAIRAATPDETVLVEDVTQIGFAAHLFYRHLAPRRFLTSGAAGTLGAGTAVAIGAAAVADVPVVAIVGDGGFMFTATELATAAQYNIDVNIVLFNDGAFGNVRRIQKTRFGPDRTIASKLDNPDFQMLAKSFGIRSWQTDSPSGLEQMLPEAMAHRGPSLVEVKVDEMPDPWPIFRAPPNRGLK